MPPPDVSDNMFSECTPNGDAARVDFTRRTSGTLGLGVGWRPELALEIDRRADLGFVEILAEEFVEGVPAAVHTLRRRGVQVVPHGVSLSLGGAEPLDPHRLRALARLAEAVQAPLVSEHLAFVRGGGLETGHLLPLPRRRDAVDLLVRHIREAQTALPVPMAVENIAYLFEWPNPEMDEAEFLTEIIERTQAYLLLDVENVYANARNHGFDAWDFIERLPLERIAYVHVAGGVEREGIYHDTHAEPVPAAVLDLLTRLCQRIHIPGVMMERDDRFPDRGRFHAEMDAISAAMKPRTDHG